ncbi:MAG: lipopolysaccharide biosynthesis protein [Mycobacterium sp.]
MSSLAQSAFKGATATLFWQATRIGLLVVSIVVLARLLTPADFGLIAMVMSIIGIGELLRDFGLSVASLQARTLSAHEKSNLFWLNTAIGALLAAVVFCASWPIAYLYGDDRLIGITQALSATFLINGFTTQFKAQINRDLRFVALGATEAIPQAIGLAAAIAIAANTHSYWALVTQPLVVAILEALFGVLLAGWRPGLYKRNVPIAKFVRFAGALVGTQGLAYISKNIDSVLLGALRGPTELGIYNRAYQIVVLPLTQVTAPLSRVAIPVLSKLQDTENAFMRFLKTAQFATVTVTSLFYGVMIGFGEPLVRIALGNQWLESVIILQILAVSGIFRALGQVPYWAFVTLGETRRQLVIYTIGQPLIIGSIAVGAIWGGIGVATGCSVGYAAFWAVNMWWAGRVTQLPMGKLALSGLCLVAVFALPAAAIGAAATRLFDGTWVPLLIGGTTVFVWSAFVLLVTPAYRAEVRRFVRLARNRAKPDGAA